TPLATPAGTLPSPARPSPSSRRGNFVFRTGGDGWESNPPRTPHQRPADGFEDRGRHQPPNIPAPRQSLAVPMRRLEWVLLTSQAFFLRDLVNQVVTRGEPPLGRSPLFQARLESRAVAFRHDLRAEKERRIAQLRREVQKAEPALQSDNPGVKVNAERVLARAGAELARLGAPLVSAPEEPAPAPNSEAPAPAV